MTDMGCDNIIEKLVNRVVKMPDDDEYTLDMLSAWLSGYAQCQHDVLDLIEEMREGERR